MCSIEPPLRNDNLALLALLPNNPLTEKFNSLNKRQMLITKMITYNQIIILGGVLNRNVLSRTASTLGETFKTYFNSKACSIQDSSHI